MVVKEKMNGKTYWTGADGSLRLEEAVSDNDKAKEELFDDLFKRAKELQAEMKEFKSYAIKVLTDYMKTSAKKVKVKNWKGSFSLKNYDGSRQVSYTNREKIDFNENLQFAKSKFDEWILKVTRDGNADLASFVQKAFKVDQKGKLNKSFLLELLSYSVEDTTFKKAQELLKTSIFVAEIKPYLQFQEKDLQDMFQTIVLDFAAL